MPTWKLWFAWRPVRIDGRRIWGRWVERALFEEYHMGQMWRYRLREAAAGTCARFGGTAA
jgi:hypothetical protein